MQNYSKSYSVFYGHTLRTYSKKHTAVTRKLELLNLGKKATSLCTLCLILSLSGPDFPGDHFRCRKQETGPSNKVFWTAQDEEPRDQSQKKTLHSVYTASKRRTEHRLMTNLLASPEATTLVYHVHFGLLRPPILTSPGQDSRLRADWSKRRRRWYQTV